MDDTPGQSGLADISLDVKWRFYEGRLISAAFIPGVSFPTGDETRGLGTGRTSWNAFLVTSYRHEPWTFHLHVGHVHHNNTFNERVNVWHASAALVFKPVDNLKLVLDSGIDTNTDRSARSDPVFLVTGLIWSPRPDFDIDLGLRWESSDVARTRALLAGLTFRR